MLQAGRQRVNEVEDTAERYTVDCLSSGDGYVCAIVCSAERIRSIFVWSTAHHIEIPQRAGLTSLDDAQRVIELPIGHAKYISIATHKFPGSRGKDSDLQIAASSRKLIELWRLNMLGDIVAYACVELSETASKLLFSPSGDLLSCLEGRSTISVRESVSLNTIATFKKSGEQPVDATFVRNTNHVNIKISHYHTFHEDVVIVCYESGKVMGWGLNSEAPLTGSDPFVVLEYAISSRSGPCGITAISRSSLPWGRAPSTSTKTSPLIGSENGLIIIVADRDSKIWFIEALDLSNPDLPFVCREVRCLDLEREIRYSTSPSRAAREPKLPPSDEKPSAGSRSRMAPIRTRPSGAVQQDSPVANFNAGGMNQAASTEKSAPPAMHVQKPGSGALLSLSLYSSLPSGNSMPMATAVILLYQSCVMSVNIQTFKLDNSILFENVGLSTLSAGSLPTFCGISESGKKNIELALQPAFSDKFFPYSLEFNCNAPDTSRSNRNASPLKNASPIKKAGHSKRTSFDNSRADDHAEVLGIISCRPVPTWAQIPVEKQQDSSKDPSYNKNDNEIDKGRVDNYNGLGGSNGTKPSTFCFFTSTLSNSAIDPDDGVGDDDLRIGLPRNSPLMAVFKPPPTPSMHIGAARAASKGRASGKSWEAPVIDKVTGAVKDQPVTFHDRVKSSGYGQAKPKPPNFAAKAKRKPTASTKGTGAEVYSQRTATEQSGLRSVSAPRAMQGRGNAPSGRMLRTYPMDCMPCVVHQAHNDHPSQKRDPRNAADARTVGPLHALQYSEDGAWLGIVSQDSAIETLKMPISKHGGAGLCYMGHDAGLNSINFSHDNNFMISSSTDGTARMWRLGRVEAPAIIFSHRLSQPRIGGPGKLGIATAPRSGAATNSRNKPFGGDIVTAQFFHLDRFVMLASKASVYMYTFEPEGTDALNDIKRLQSYGKYKLVTEFSHADTHRVSAFSCINSVQSVLCVSATADRKLHLLDTAVGATAYTTDVTHDKAIHCIALPQPSVHCRVSDPHAYNTFATASTDNSILLWDIRVPSSVCRYSAHVNRREAVKCALSPCMRYLATGSEDRTIRIVDLRTGMRELSKVGSGLFKDVVTGVSFHPLHAQLAACSFDGSVKFFTEGEYQT